MSSSREILFWVDNTVIFILLALLVIAVAWRHLFRWSTRFSLEGSRTATKLRDPAMIEIPAHLPGGTDETVLILTGSTKKVIPPYTWLTQGLSAAGNTVILSPLESLVSKSIQDRTFKCVIVILEKGMQIHEKQVQDFLVNLPTNRIIIISKRNFRFIREIGKSGLFERISEKNKMLHFIVLLKDIRKELSIEGSYQRVFKVQSRFASFTNAELLVLSKVLTWTN
ncbi:MAG: hypothetical protein ACFFCS_17330 [Candidatus Hodarchaeota archaeon]